MVLSKNSGSKAICAVGFPKGDESGLTVVYLLVAGL